jgi:acyl-CoA dehydrogenase
LWWSARTWLQLVRLEHKLGIRASDTAAFVLANCRVPAEDLLGDPEIRIEGGFGGAMQTFDNTRRWPRRLTVPVGH